jgi:hypothetical protein
MIRIIIAGALALGLAACASNTNPPTPAPVIDVQSIANDVAQVDTAAQNALANPAIQALLPPATLPKVQQALAALASVSAAMVANPASAVTKGNVEVVISDLETLTSAASGVVPPPYSTYLEAANIILPVAEIAIGIIAPASITPAEHNLAWARAHIGPPRETNN